MVSVIRLPLALPHASQLLPSREGSLGAPPRGVLAAILSCESRAHLFHKKEGDSLS